MRLFVAINLPADVREAIVGAAAPLRGGPWPIRWIDGGNLHLTLKFLGGVDAEREPDVAAGLDAACRGVRGFTIPLDGFGAFPPGDRPRVVWVGAEAVPPLELLQHGIEREMERLGFPIDGRPFRPHLTVGRARRDAGWVPGLADRLEAIALRQDVPVSAVDLMGSTLARSGARYERRHSVPLEAP